MLNNKVCILSKFIETLKNPYRIILVLGTRYRLKWIPDKTYIKLMYKAVFNKKINLKYPVTFNEKLQWIKLYDKNPIYVNMVDKYEVRNYVKEKIGEEYLIPLIGIWNCVDEIDMSQLPNEFVIKATHDSGSVIICKDKRDLNYNKLRNKMEKSRDSNYYYIFREWPYKNVKPRIIVEKLMKNKDNTDLQDYKLFCFNGKVKLILVCSDRFDGTGLKETFFNTEWERQEIKRPKYSYSQNDIPKPKTLKKMMELAEILAQNIPFIRVDFYDIDGKLYFGELTFFPAGGFERFVPNEYDYILGDWIKL